MAQANPGRFWIECPLCDHVDSHKGPLYPSHVIRLHERAIAHLRSNHARKAVRRIGVHRDGGE